MRPVNVFSRIPKEKISIGSVAIVDVILIGFILMLSMSKFVLAAGFSIDVKSPNVLPTMKNPDYSKIDSDLTVLTAKTNSMMIFDGAICDEINLQKKMKSSKRKGTLLIKADEKLTLQSLLKIAEAAKQGGFDKIHIATNPEK